MPSPRQGDATGRLGRARDASRVIGRPGAASRRGYRDAVRAYRRLPIWAAVAATALAAVLTGLVATTGGYRFAPPALTVAVLGVGGWAAARWPRVAATLAVLAIYVAILFPIAAYYSYKVNGPQTDPVGGVATLTATMALVAYFAHRTTRSRPWVTVAVAAVAITLVGPVLLAAAPWAGFAVAWLLAASVVYARSDGPPKARDRFLTATARLRSRLAADPEALPAAVTRWADKAAAAEATGAHLADLPAGYTVFHDRRLPDGTLLDHLVLGPTGAYLIDSATLPGVVREDARLGLAHDGQPLAGQFWQTLTAAKTVARALRLRPSSSSGDRGLGGVPVRPIAVLHEAVLPQPRARVALTDHATSHGDVTVLAPNRLLAEITESPQIYPPRTVRRLVARANRAFPPADRPTEPAAATTALPGLAGRILDADGHLHRDPDPDGAAPLFESDASGTEFTLGQPVTLLTTNGTYTGYRVAGTPMNLDTLGTVHVPVCRDDAYTTASSTHTGVEVETWFPLDSVQPAPADA